MEETWEEHTCHLGIGLLAGVASKSVFISIHPHG